MIDTYEYRFQGRRPVSYFAFGVALLLGYIGFHTGLPSYGWAIWGGIFALSVYLLMANPAAGMRLSDDEWEIFAGARVWRIPLSDIESVRFLAEKGGACALTFASGRSGRLPRRATPAPEVLADQLRLRGIHVLAA